jgi:hypothetical protein
MAMCAVCAGALAAAEALDEWWMDLCDKLGVSLNLDKRQRCSHRVECACFLLDTFCGVLLVTEAKISALFETLDLFKEEVPA